MESSELLNLIDAHKSAYARLNHAVGLSFDIEEAVADAEAGIAAREQASGLTAAQAAVAAAEAEEAEARLALAVYAPRNAAEKAAKRQYIENATPFRDGWCSDNDEFVAAMIARIDKSARS